MEAVIIWKTSRLCSGELTGRKAILWAGNVKRFFNKKYFYYAY